MNRVGSYGFLWPFPWHPSRLNHPGIQSSLPRSTKKRLGTSLQKLHLNHILVTTTVSLFTILVSAELASSSFYFPLLLHALDINNPSSKHVQKVMGSTLAGDSDSFPPQVRNNRIYIIILTKFLTTLSRKKWLTEDCIRRQGIFRVAQRSASLHFLTLIRHDSVRS